MLMAAIILFGVISFYRLGISQLPDVDFPVVSVSLTLNGAAPEVIESQVLDPLEDAIMQIDGIRSVTSTAQQSSGSIAVEFELNRNIDESMQEIQNKINQVSNILPVNLFPPTLRKSNPEDQPILWLALTTDDPNEKPIDMMIYARNFLFNQFSTLPGVGNIAMGGYVDPALRVWVDLPKLDKLEFTSDDLLTSVTSGHNELPAGRIENSKKEYNVRVMGEATSPEEFGKITIDSRNVLGPNYRTTTLNQVAKIEEGVADIRKISRFNRSRAVGLGILKQHGSNAVEVGRLVREKLLQILPLIPAKYHVDVRSDNTRFIKQSVDELIFTLALSALLTSLVCYLFLGSWTSTMNVLMAIPTSIVGAFTVFYFLNFTLNTFTLLGLSLAIGIVVDDAIMMLENIVRHRELGESKRNAALKGAKEITFAALAATLAVVAIFLPVVFMQGVIGKYFLQYGITVTVAVLLSLLEALTLTPMRCSRYLEVNLHPTGLAGFVDRFFVKLAARYQRILGGLLRHRVVTLIVTLAIFAVSLISAKFIPSEMMPAQDQAMFLMRFKLPVGTSLPVTNAKIGEVEEFLMKQPEVSGVFSAVGGFGGDAVNQGMAFVSLVDRDKRKLSQAELINKFRTELKSMTQGSTKGMEVGTGGPPKTAEVGKPAVKPPEAEVAGSTDKHAPEASSEKHEGKDRHGKTGMQINIQDLSLRGFASSRGYPVEFIIQGPDWDKLSDVSGQVMSEMRKSGLVTDTNTDIQPGMPEVQLTPNRAKLAAHGVSLNTITGVINALVGGAILNHETEYSKAGHRYEIELRLLADQREEVPALDRIRVRNNRGETVPLSELVDLEIKPSLMLISRLNRSRAITIYANPAPGISQNQALVSIEKMARSLLPSGYSLKMTGSSQSFRESFQSLLWAMLLGLIVSYMVLASQFNSFIHPITVLMALPFSFSGAFVGLLAFHQSINIFSMIGFILLMGIVKKNSILLVDFTNQMRDEGHDVHTALLKACPVRLRPILMTSVATVAGALPEALSIGPGAETTIPMAVAIIGGVIASTFLTLFVVPVVYSLLARLESRDPLDAAIRQRAEPAHA
jgi:HAE1 family hydrophobic/amphiphilic exporter-1